MNGNFVNCVLIGINYAMNLSSLIHTTVLTDHAVQIGVLRKHASSVSTLFILRAFPTRATRLSSLGVVVSESSEREIGKLSKYIINVHCTM